jgi:hypothetical protein
MESAVPRYHPTTGRQNGVDHFINGKYVGTYDNRGVFHSDPHHRSVIAE